MSSATAAVTLRPIETTLQTLSVKYGMKGERGMDLLNAPRPNLLRFMPALNVTAEEIDLMLSELDKLIAQARKA
ncbi:acetylornithine transaminase [Achromobacter marplatensis]